MKGEYKGVYSIYTLESLGKLEDILPDSKKPMSNGEGVIPL